MDEFRQVEDRGLAAGDKGEEVSRLQRRQGDAEFLVDGQAVGPVELPEDLQDAVPVIFGEPSPLVHEGFYRRIG